MKKIVWIYALALFIRIAIGLFYTHDWDGYVFLESSKQFLAGQSPYKVVLSNPLFIYADSDRDIDQQWYAYPPVPIFIFSTPVAIMNLFKTSLPIFIQFFAVKTPMIFADLLLAYLVKRFLQDYKIKSANKAELLILFNPLLIWISSAWGMFDNFVICALLAFLLAIERKKPALAGFFLAIMLLIKLYALFIALSLVLFAVYKFQTADRKIFLLTLIFSGLAICLPFYYQAPYGFINQTLLMHVFRTPQGLSVTALLDYGAFLFNRDVGWLVWLLNSVMYLLIFVLPFLFLPKIKNSFQLIAAVVVEFSLVILLNKVVNEQYFVFFVTLLILLKFAPKNSLLIPAKIIRIFEVYTTIGVLTVAALLGFHFFVMLSPDISMQVFKYTSHVLVYFLGLRLPVNIQAYPTTLTSYYNLPYLATFLIMIPYNIFICFMLISSFKNFLPKNNAKFYLNNIRSILQPTTITPLLGVIFLVELVLFVTFPSNTFASPIKLPSPTVKTYPKVDKVGTFYNVWWNNNSHFLDNKYADWTTTTVDPELGFYSSKNWIFNKHISEMKGAGIDFAAVSYHLYDRARYLNFINIAEKNYFHVSPLIEMHDILAFDNFRPTNNFGIKFFGFTPSEKSKVEVEKTILSSLSESYKSPAMLTIDSKPVVFIYDGHWFFPDYSQDEMRSLAQLILDKYSNSQDPYQTISSVWGVTVNSLEDIYAEHPAKQENFLDDNPIARDYKQAFLTKYEKFWKDIKYDITSKVGPIYLISTYTPDRTFWQNFTITPDDFKQFDFFDAEFFYSPSNTWVAYRRENYDQKMTIWNNQVARQAERAKELKKPLIVPVIPEYNDTIVRAYTGFKIPSDSGHTNTYDKTWKIALNNRADIVMIATWNEFYEGSAIEPSKQRGNFYLNATKRWTDFFNSYQVTK